MSKKIYCVASFEPKEGKLEELFEMMQGLEPKTIREDGCIQYVVTKHIANPYATGNSFALVFNEIWKNKEAFEAHCERDFIKEFFQSQCIDKDGLVKEFNVCTYSDE